MSDPDRAPESRSDPGSDVGAWTRVRVSPPGAPLRGTLAPPGSKSLTNRALLLAGLSNGTSRLTGILRSDDTRHMLACLRALGVGVEDVSEHAVTVTGTGRLRAPAEPLYVGNAGTAARFLAAATALCDAPVSIDGNEAMRTRPIEPLLHALRDVGLGASSATGFFPVRTGGAFEQRRDEIVVDASLSSQYVSALLMIAPRLPRGLALAPRDPGASDGFGYIDLTVDLMARFGAKTARERDADGRVTRWRVEPADYRGTDVAIEPDASSLTYVLAAEALSGGRIEVGAEHERSAQPDAASFPYIRAYRELPDTLDCSMMQDAVPTLAVLAAVGGRRVRLTGLKNLRVKECDRVHAIATELGRFDEGVVRVDVDDLIIDGTRGIEAGRDDVVVCTYDDHRIAMAFALLGLVRHGVVIDDPGCVAKTYPGYWRDLATLGVELVPPD